MKNKRYEGIFTHFEYDVFASLSSKSKNLSLQDVFAKQLLQIPHCTSKKVWAIVQEYPTPKSLFNAYQKTQDGKRLLEKIEYGEKRRKIGPKLSETIYNYFCSNE